jgi:hypothetical protein
VWFPGRRRRLRQGAAWREVEAFRLDLDGWMAGQVVKVYQRARTGMKAVVDFRGYGQLDTWWPARWYPPGTLVRVQAHKWMPPGTHSGQPVWWVDEIATLIPPRRVAEAELFARKMAAGKRQPTGPEPPGPARR